jgi:hypothetical protein
MKRILQLVLLFTYSHVAFAQHIAWLQSDTIGYNSNPQFPLHKLAATSQGAVVTKLSASHQLYGNEILGDYTLDNLDSTGSLLWRVMLLGKVKVAALAVDGAENIYLGGDYMETLYINGSDTMLNTGSGFDKNYFLMSFSPQGILRWKKNLSLTNNNIYDVTTMAKDANGLVWYVMQRLNSFSHQMTQLDSNGNELTTYTTSDTRLCNSISFDANNNLYLAGSTESGTININGLTETVPESYMMFVSRINNAGQTSWIKLAIDITFQTPQVVALPNGEAILGGNNFDSTTWGSINFPDNYFGTSFFLTRVDSNANFLWGYGLPLNDTGYFDVGSGHFFDVDAVENIYVTGTMQGTIHFTPSLVVNSGLPATFNLGILKLDGNGQVLSLKLGGGMNSNYPQDICMSGVDKGYVVATIVGEAIFDSLSTGVAGLQSAMVIRFDDGNATTNIDPVNGKEFSVFPNPFTDRLVLHGIDGKVNVELLNVLGYVVSEPYTMNGEIKLPSLAKGIYFLRVGNQVKRLMKAE